MGNDVIILAAEKTDLPAIHALQRLAYQSEATLVGNRDILPLRESLEEIQAQFAGNLFLKAVDATGEIIGSVRAKPAAGTLRIGKLMVHPDRQGGGIGTGLLAAVENRCPLPRFELFTSVLSERNIALYKRCGYVPFKEEAAAGLRLVFLEKRVSAMPIIATDRLRIVPLTERQFALWLDSVPALERELSLQPSHIEWESETRAAMEWLHRKTLRYPDDLLWYTSWQICRGEVSVGSACFKGPPDFRGAVEIGYGVHQPERNKGYMCEAAAALCRWALGMPGVRMVTAVTDRNNPASHTVCRRCGMENVGGNEFSLFWRRDGA